MGLEVAPMQFKIEIREMKSETINGFIFSMKHPEKDEYIYEFLTSYMEIGKQICNDIIKEINEGLGEENAKSE